MIGMSLPIRVGPSKPKHGATARRHEMASSKRAEGRKRIAYSREATLGILKFLSGQRRNVQVRRIVAAHPHTPPEILWALANDNDMEVRQAVALNQSSPADFLAHLAGSGVDHALLVAMNPDVPLEVLNSLTRDGAALVQFLATATSAERALLCGNNI